MGETATVNAAPQHLRALKHANRVRLARADLKRKIASQETDAADVVLNCPWEAASMEISDVLTAQRR
jgi:D-hexose-6-phosphate mutarotase